RFAISVCVQLLYTTFFFFHVSPPTQTYTLSLHDALPIYDPSFAAGDLSTSFIDERPQLLRGRVSKDRGSKILNWLVDATVNKPRSEEHTSELQSRENLVCRLLLEKKKNHDAIGSKDMRTC